MVDLRSDDVRDRLGNIDQIRNLLFGDVMADYEQRLSLSVERVDRLEAELTHFQADIRQQLTQFQESLTTELRKSLSTLETQVQYLTHNAQEQTNAFQFRLHELEHKGEEQIEGLHNSLTGQATSLKAELLQVREQLELALRALERRVVDEMDKDLAAVKTSKVSRTDLADILFELCLKVKGAETNAQLASSINNGKNNADDLPGDLLPVSADPTSSPS